jgi:hypothetical protein
VRSETPPPPITVPPDVGDTTPPADAISDTVWPIQSCGDWQRVSDYGGRWPTGSSWWEYVCGRISDATDARTGNSVSDPRQRTGRRVELPKLSIPFSGPIGPASVASKTVVDEFRRADETP